MPPHNGHRYLIEFARRFAHRVTVLVCTLSHEPIPGALRYQWMRELFPDLNVIHVTDEIPEAGRSNPRAYEIWAAFIKQRLRLSLQYVFASESYGTALAAELGARFIPVDPARSNFPISASAIREDPAAHWRYIPEPVRPYFQRRVCLVGGSAAERRELAVRLAAEFNTLAVPDMRRIRTELLAAPGTGSRISELRQSQRSAEAALARQAGPLLICAADALVIALGASETAPDSGGTTTAETHSNDRAGRLGTPPSNPAGTGSLEAGEDRPADLYIGLPADAAQDEPEERAEARAAAELRARGAHVVQLSEATPAAAAGCVRRYLHSGAP